MVTRIRQRLAADEGLTLVEMLVAISILMVISAALAATLISSLRALVLNETRLRAHQVANEVLEDLRVLNWNQVGFYQSDVDALGSDAFEDEPYVVIPDPEVGADPDPRVPNPTSVIDRDGHTYEVELHITWVDEDQTSEDEDFKRFTVFVTWDDGARTLRNEAVRAPTPEEKEPSAFAIREWYVDPELAYIDDNGYVIQKVNPDGTTSPVTEVNLRVVMTAPVSSVTVTYTNRTGGQFGPLDLNPDEHGIEWTLTRSIGQYRNGDTQFTFIATDDRYPDQEAEAVKVVRYVHFDVVFEDGPSIENEAGDARDYVCVDAGGAGLQARAVRAQIKGMTDDDLVVVSGAGLSEEPPTYAAHVGSYPSGSYYELILPAGYVYPTGASSVVLAMDPERAFDEATVAGGDPDPRLSPPMSIIRPDEDGEYPHAGCAS